MTGHQTAGFEGVEAPSLVVVIPPTAGCTIRSPVRVACIAAWLLTEDISVICCFAEVEG